MDIKDEILAFLENIYPNSVNFWVITLRFYEAKNYDISKTLNKLRSEGKIYGNMIGDFTYWGYAPQEPFSGEISFDVEI